MNLDCYLITLCGDPQFVVRLTKDEVDDVERQLNKKCARYDLILVDDVSQSEACRRLGIDPYL